MHATALLNASDNLVHALYIPQNHETIASCTKAHMESTRNLQSIITSVYRPHRSEAQPGPSSDGMENLQISVATLNLRESQLEEMPEKDRKDWKWFHTCFEQIARTTESLDESASKSTQ